MVLAYDFPLLSIFWVVLWSCFVVSVFFGVIWSFIDNFRRSDHHGWAKAGWALFILLFPLLGTFVYILARPAAVASAEQEWTTGVPRAA